MHMPNGEAEALLPGEREWRTVKAGDDFHIPANSSYQFHCTVVCEYICDYL